MGHSFRPEAEEILDKEYKVLDKGFVRLVDYMGSDERIVQAARVSYGEGTKTVRQDKGLIDYLLRNDHTSPFEQVVFTFHVKMPIFVARQWIRHRTARVNEISGRYSVMRDECYLPDYDDIAVQSSDNKQGRQSEPVSQELGHKVLDVLSKGQKQVFEAYQDLLNDDIARELARINLPLSMYTEMYWQMDLHNLFRFIGLRLDMHAQKEIRAYASVILEMIKKICPMAVASFEEYVVGSVRLSAKEKSAVQRMLNGDKPVMDERELERLRQKLNID